MSVHHSAPRPFIFDTEFDADGRVIQPSDWQPPKRSYSPAEVEALLAGARLEARQQALNEVEALRANALSVVAQTIADASHQLGGVVERHRHDAAALSLACAKALSGAAFDLFPRRPLEAAIEQLAEEIDASPRLLIRAHDLDAEGRHQIEQLCQQAGFSGLVVFRDDASHAAAFALEWTDGRASFDPFEVEKRLRERIGAVLDATQNSVSPHTDGSAF